MKPIFMADPTHTRLFCIPHAGGSAIYYSGFTACFSGAIDVQPLEMAGRGRRCREPLATSLDDISRDLFAHIDPLPVPARGNICLEWKEGTHVTKLSPGRARGVGKHIPEYIDHV